VLPLSRQLSVLLIIFGVILLPSCADDAPEEPRSQPTTTAPSTTTTTTSPAQADEAALRQLAEDWYRELGARFEAGASTDGADRYLMDPYLTQFEQQVQDFLDSGNQTEISERSDQTIESVEVEGDSGVVVECVVNANILRGPDGDVINDEVAARRIETVARRGSDGWRLSERRILEELEEAECDQ
jgi:hypothetical protein